MARRASMPIPPQEDPLDPLPPLDGDSRDAPIVTEDDELVDDESDATLDDTTGEDVPADARELDIEGEESGWLTGTGEALDLDVGAADIGEFSGAGLPADDVEEDGARDEDLLVDAAAERGGLDAGEEGPLDADEELREADLPCMDADEEGEIDDGALVDAAFVSDEPLGLQWSAQPWSRVGAPLPLWAASAVACASRWALVVGRAETGAMELARIDLEGTCERIRADGLALRDVRKLAVDGNVVVAVVEGGQLLVSWDGGEAFAPVDGSLVVADAALVSGALWVRTRGGALLVEDEFAATRSPSSLERVDGAANDSSSAARFPLRSVAALACDRTSAIAAIFVEEGARPVAVARGLRKASIETETVDAPDMRAPALLAAYRGHLAYPRPRGGVIRRQADGEWLSFVWEGRITALAFVDDEGTLVAATYSEIDDTTALVRLDTRGKASVVARLGAQPADAESDGQVVSMAHDDARGVVWVAGGFGVAVFAVR